MKAAYFHLDKIEIFVRDGFVQGIGMTYNLDGIKMTKVNKGKKMPKASYELELAQDEHIEFVQFRFTDEGIHEIMIKTNLNRMLMMDEPD
jgi:Zn/Cd-binding protein ZinT